MFKPNQEILEVEQYRRMERSPVYFIQMVWGLVPQPIKREYYARLALGLQLKGKAWDKFASQVSEEWFGPYVDSKHFTWQQYLALVGIEKAIRGDVPWRISIVSGHGIGKSAMLAWVILWFLFVHPMAKAASTSPSKEQMYDVLWSELKKWIDKMPDMIKQFYRWESSHIRMVEAPQEWFARAKTSSKENTEALAGIHADWVLMAVDEASGVEEPIFETMEGALTSGNILVFLISNGTRNLGYFYDSHHKKAEFWQCFSFNALESPRVSEESVQKWKDEYGEDSVQYAVRVKGLFPDEGTIDDKGYVQLFNEKDIRFVPHDPNHRFIGRTIGALDASGEGQDLSAWAARDRQILMIPYTEKTSNSKGMAATSVTLCDKFHIDPIDFVIDNFGSGANTAQEIALMTSQEKRPWRVTPINVGEACDDEYDKEQFINKRAEAYYKMMLWTRAGGSFMELPTPEETKRFKEELLSIRFKRTLSGRIQIMDKVQMKKLGIKSQNLADAGSMTFLRPDGAKRSTWGDPISVTGQASNPQFDPFSPLGD
jgi:phage terminase large subunit